MPRRAGRYLQGGRRRGVASCACIAAFVLAMLAPSAHAGAGAPLAGSRSAEVGAQAPNDGDFTAIFAPVFVRPALVTAPTSRVTDAFRALNQLFDAQTRLAEVIVALRVSLDRQAAAAAAGEQLLVARQMDAAARFALEASSLVWALPRLDAAVVSAFTADGLRLRITRQQFAAAQAHLAHGLPPEVTKVLGIAAATLRPQTNPEVKTLQARLLSTKALELAIAHATPTALRLPGALDSPSLTAAENRAAAALKKYANAVLHPTGTAVHARFHSDAPCSGCGGGNNTETLETVHYASLTLEGVGKAAETVGAVTSAVGSYTSGLVTSGIGEGVGALGEAGSYTFAAGAFNAANSAFTDGTGEGGGGSPSPGSGYTEGDPHIGTFTDQDFEFQSAGEFTLLRSGNGDIDVQIRLQPNAGTIWAPYYSLLTAVALRVGDATVQVDPGAQPAVLVDGRPVALPPAGMRLAGGGSLQLDALGDVAVRWPGGSIARVRPLNAYQIDALDLTFTPGSANSPAPSGAPPAPAQRLGGLLTSLVASSGTGEVFVGGNGRRYAIDLATTSGFRTFYGPFADSWRITQAESLFTYPQGKSTSSYTIRPFPAHELRLASFPTAVQASAEQTCKKAGVTNEALLSDCAIDVAATGKAGFAAATRGVQDQVRQPRPGGTPTSGSTTPATGPTGPTASSPGTLSTIDADAGTGGAVVVDSAGNGYLAWERHGDTGSVLFCRIPRNGRCTHTIELPLPAAVRGVGVLQPFPVLGKAAGVAYVVALGDLDGKAVIWTSSDGGSGFSAGTVVNGEPDASALDDVILDPTAEPVGSTTDDDMDLVADDPSLSYGVVGDSLASAAPPSVSLGQVYDITPSLGLSGTSPVIAFDNETSADEVEYYWAASTAVGTASQWQGPVKVTAGVSPRLASGPDGLFLLSEDLRGVEPSELDVRRWDPVTHRFGPPVVVVDDANSTSSPPPGEIFEDATTGELYVLWPSSNSAGALVLRMWTSTDRGRSFSGPTVVATPAAGYADTLPRLAMTAGHGFLTFEDGAGLELVDLSSP